MKGNVFSQWLKEFCALVFTQTVQAFLLAIVLTIVLMSVSMSNGYEKGIRNQAGGVLAIVALTSMSNIEKLIRKMFGLESGITDTSMGGGRPALLSSLFAIKMARRALDNIPKIGSGIAGTISANRNIKSARLGLVNDKAKEYERYNALYGNNGGSLPQGTGYENNSNASGTNTYGDAGSSSGSRNSGRANISDFASDDVRISDPNKYLKERYKIQDKIGDIESKYKKQIEEAQKQRRDSIRRSISGVTESVGTVTGGVLGGATGAVFAAGSGGDVLGDMSRGAGIGVGVGDRIGQQAVELPGRLHESIIQNAKMSESLSGYGKKLKAANEKLEKEMRKFNAGNI